MRRAPLLQRLLAKPSARPPALEPPQPVELETTAKAGLIAPTNEDHALREAAWSGLPSDGLILEGFYSKANVAAQARAAIAARLGDLDERLEAIRTKMRAQLEEPPAPEPVPTVLESLSKILPFTKGA